MKLSAFKTALLCLALAGVFQPAISTRALAEPDMAASSKEMERRLEALRVRYTEDHPDVQRMRRLLERVKKKEAADRARKAADQNTVKRPDGRARKAADKNKEAAGDAAELGAGVKQSTNKPGNNQARRGSRNGNHQKSD